MYHRCKLFKYCQIYLKECTGCNFLALGQHHEKKVFFWGEGGVRGLRLFPSPSKYLNKLYLPIIWRVESLQPPEELYILCIGTALVIIQLCVKQFETSTIEKGNCSGDENEKVVLQMTEHQQAIHASGSLQPTVL